MRIASIATALDFGNVTDITIADSEHFINFVEDPLLISCTLYRLITELPATDQADYRFRCWSIETDADKIVPRITDQDRIFAEVVRSYYKGKLLVAKLRGATFTRYRNDLLTYLNDSPLRVSNKFAGLLYKLPYFYEYDTKLTEVFGGEYFETDGLSVIKDTKNLKFIAKLDTHKKRKAEYEYWFNDENDNRYVVEVAKHNPLLKLWETAINSNVKIRAKFEKKHKDNWSYYVATGWNINVSED